MSSNVLPLPYQYCQLSDIQNYLSAQGVTLRLADQPGNVIDSFGNANVQDILNEATVTIDFYCFGKYTPAILATSMWVNRKATILAAYRIGSRRGNPVPEIIVEDAGKAEEELKAIADGPRLIPNLPLRRILAPTMSITRCDPRYIFKVIRVERNQSSRWSPTQLPQNQDWQDAFVFEL